MHPKVRFWMIFLSIIGIIYGALVSLMQKDMKKLVAYSSVSHLGFCTLGIFALNPAGLSGSVLQQINHGISTGALFLIVGILYERRHTREISEYGGISNVMPLYATITMIMFLSSMGLPLLNGFVGEFTILQGTFMENWKWAAWAVPGVILAAAYLLWLYQRVFFGTVTNPKNEKLHDLTPRELLTFAPLVIMAFWIGLYPKPFFQILRAARESARATRFGPTIPGSCGPVNASAHPREPLMANTAAVAVPDRPLASQRGRNKCPACRTILHRHGLSAVASHHHAHPVRAGHSADRPDDPAGVEVDERGDRVGGRSFFRRRSGEDPVLPNSKPQGSARSKLRFPALHGGRSLLHLFLVSVSGGSAISILMSVRYLEIEHENHGEFYSLILFSVVGMMCMASGFDIVLIFIGLELMAISTYVLVGFLRTDRRSNEAALKYLLLGAFSSGIFAYGLSLLYGLTGSTRPGGDQAGAACRWRRTPITSIRSR